MGLGGIFPNGPDTRHANSTQWRHRVPKLYAWAFRDFVDFALAIWYKDIGQQFPNIEGDLVLNPAATAKLEGKEK